MSKVITDENRIKEVLEKGVEKIYPRTEALEKKLKSGKRIRLYCGYDPTAPSLHLGHVITLRKLAQFQRLGHEVIFLIGDFTAMIGDPTDKTAARKRLTEQQVQKNLKNYKKQANKILKFSGENPAKVMFNSKWNSKLTPDKLMDLAFNFSVQQMLVRDMFRERLKRDKQILLPEFLYPLFQAYDSVVLDVDLEVGGKDQIFNMLRGRDLMRIFKKKEKFVLALKLLEDPTGKKMGKTEGNIVNLDENPKEMYGKIMSWPDALIISGFELCTDWPMDKVREMGRQIKDKKINPRDAKARLAREIVVIHYDKTAAFSAEKEFNRIFKEHKAPEKVKTCKLREKSLNILDLLVRTKLASSKSEAKRLVEQKGVKIDKEIIDDWKKEIIIVKGMILRVGKRKFLKLI